MRLVRLIYASETSLQPGDDAVQAILKNAEKHNTEYDITGALFMHEGYFVQCLEGHRVFVNDLYNRICQDSRHANVQLLYFSEIVERIFSKWSMVLSMCPEKSAKACIRFLPSREFNPNGLPAASANAMMEYLAEELEKDSSAKI